MDFNETAKMLIMQVGNAEKVFKVTGQMHAHKNVKTLSWFTLSPSLSTKFIIIFLFV